MNTNQLFEYIENWCRCGLTFRYQPHAAPVSFYRTLPVHTLKGRDESYTIVFENDPAIERFLQRFPQTRIYIQTFLSSAVRVRAIEYFDTILLLIDPITNSKKQTLRLSIADGLTMVSTKEPNQLSGHEYVLSCEEAQIIWLFPQRDKHEMSSIKRFLKEVLEREYSLHPLSRLRLSDSAEMQRIDVFWSTLRSVGPNREIQFSVDESPKKWIQTFIWLQEIYLHFGWYSELDRFYKQFNFKESVEPGLQKLFARFDSIRSAKQKEPVSKNADNGFLEHYLGNLSDDSAIQNYWQYLHYPAYRLWLKKEMGNHPGQFVAFAAIALKRSFFWYTKYKKLLSEFLPEPMRGAAGLFLQLKELTPYYPDSGQLAFIPFFKAANIRKLILKESDTVLALVWQHKKVFTKFQWDKGIRFSIDQAVQFDFNLSDSHLTITPNLFRPPLATSKISRAEIKIDSVLLSLPLLWRQFEVVLNRVRLKFLRKKDRFQVHIRGKNDTDTFYINGQKMKAQSGHYPVFYIPVSKAASQTEAAAFNEWGAMPSLSMPAFIHGWTFDSFHILQEKTQLSVAGQKKSNRFTLNINHPKNEAPVQVNREYRLNGRYSDGYVVPVQTGDGYVESLLYTAAEALQNRLLVYSDAPPRETARYFYAAFGFYPSVRPLREVRPEQNTFVIIINSTFNGAAVSEADGYKTISLFPDKRQRGILLHPANKKSFLRTHFSRNKFDFNK